MRLRGPTYQVVLVQIATKSTGEAFACTSVEAGRIAILTPKFRGSYLSHGVTRELRLAVTVVAGELQTTGEKPLQVNYKQQK